MRKYDYACKDCKESFVLEKTAEQYVRGKGKERCPYCKSKNVKRIISISPVIYKDGGFTLHTKA